VFKEPLELELRALEGRLLIRVLGEEEGLPVAGSSDVAVSFEFVGINVVRGFDANTLEGQAVEFVARVARLVLWGGSVAA